MEQRLCCPAPLLLLLLFPLRREYGALPISSHRKYIYSKFLLPNSLFSLSNAADEIQTLSKQSLSVLHPIIQSVNLKDPRISRFLVSFLFSIDRT